MLHIVLFTNNLKNFVVEQSVTIIINYNINNKKITLIT